MENKTITDYVTEKEKSLLALGIFLLLTVTLSNYITPLSKLLGTLSAGISYFLFLEIMSKSKGDENLSLILLKVFISYFTLTFCVWVILNLLFPLETIYDILMGILWLVSIFVLPLKILNGKTLIIYIILAIIMISYILITSFIIK